MSLEEILDLKVGIDKHGNKYVDVPAESTSGDYGNAVWPLLESIKYETVNFFVSEGWADDEIRTFANRLNKWSKIVLELTDENEDLSLF